MRFFYLIITFFLINLSAQAKVELSRYGIISITDSVSQKKERILFVDSMVATNPLLISKTTFYDIEKKHELKGQTTDFYLFIILCLLLGIIRIIDVKYFNNIWSAFIKPTIGEGQVIEQLRGAGLLNFFMNMFSTVTMGIYLYYLAIFFTTPNSINYHPLLLIFMLIIGIAIIYITKYLAIRFSGWAFKLEGITTNYLFNVFLINKIIGIVLIPFIAIIAFADQNWKLETLIVSFVVIGILMFARYFRSWQVFGSFFKFSKFHFFLYLCASEILPFAVLMKLLINRLLF